MGLPEKAGLFMPEFIPRMPNSFFERIEELSFQELSFELAHALIGDSIPKDILSEIVKKAINFPAPVVEIDNNIGVLELFHGPSLAFKDFGARFMAGILGYLNQGEERKLVILVATSGDTGGAVASGFLKTEGVEVVVLYPAGRVSMLQEKQLTTLGYNITALEVKGSFDACQDLVKNAFSDVELNEEIRLSSANSINIARLLPQIFYYFEAYKQIKAKGYPIVFSVPSGNFGNLTAGLIAKRMGLPVKKFIAGTNINDIIPEYLKTGIYTPKASIATISNAMDVGNPSNFLRMIDLYYGIPANLNDDMVGFSFNDEETCRGMKEVYEKYGYIIDPHGAIGYLALKEYLKKDDSVYGIILETAHPAKFKKEVEKVNDIRVEIPERLRVLSKRTKKSVAISTDYAEFNHFLRDNYS